MYRELKNNKYEEYLLYFKAFLLILGLVVFIYFQYFQATHHSYTHQISTLDGTSYHARNVNYTKNLISFTTLDNEIVSISKYQVKEIRMIGIKYDEK